MSPVLSSLFLSFSLASLRFFRFSYDQQFGCSCDNFPWSFVASVSWSPTRSLLLIFTKRYMFLFYLTLNRVSTSSNCCRLSSRVYLFCCSHVSMFSFPRVLRHTSRVYVVVLCLAANFPSSRGSLSLICSTSASLRCIFMCSRFYHCMLKLLPIEKQMRTIL